LLQKKKTFIAAKNTQHVRGRPPEENQGLHRAGHYFFLETKTNQAREGKIKFSLSLFLSFSRFSVAEDTSSCSFRSLERPQTRRNNNKEQKQAHEKSRSSVSLCLCALLLLPRLLGNPRLGNGDWYTWEKGTNGL
jgi:hypothetical protein